MKRFFEVQVPCVYRQTVFIEADSEADVPKVLCAYDASIIEVGPPRFQAALLGVHWPVRDRFPGVTLSEEHTVVIRNLRDLAEYVGADYPEPAEGELAEESHEKRRRSIAQHVSKYTDCGCSFWCPESELYVTVAGYCEGTDMECPVHELAFPFPHDAWDAAIAEADQEGEALWNETHGCEECARIIGCEYVPGSTPTVTECPLCKGDGEVI